MCHPVNLDRHEVIVSDLTRMLRFPKSFADTNQAVRTVCSRGPGPAPQTHGSRSGARDQTEPGSVQARKVSR
jgi:hypothetical protein